ncbi:vacuolar protein sorting/targeting protein 10 [[Candida] railenensis]|uniref:Vacuolar protein sorting/targeting protein 10 n=1 Tax=[Candida] railenensis TaxID=45579 RepID=A0A9P0QQ39_9ASCO|nr:vacuolar protein sorting/targeting protein 10 [[Candida] railenensis]
MVSIKSRNWTLLSVLVTFICVVSAEFQPTISKLKEDHVAEAYSYFDDSTTILGSRKNKLIISFDDGKSWETIKETKEETIIHYQMDIFLRERAFAFTADNAQFVTYDKGQHWSKFNIKDPKDSSKLAKIDSIPRVLFNSKNPNLALFDFYSCPELEHFSERCKHLHYYTTDGFKTDPKPISIDTNICHFAKSTKAAIENKVDHDATLFCTQNKINSFGHVIESNLYKTTDFFQKDKTLVQPNGLDKTGSYTNFKVIQNFIILVVRLDKFNVNSKIALFVSRDYENFDMADLVVDVSYGAIEFLESNPSSIELVVMDYSNPMEDVALAAFYGSDSTGLAFTKKLDFVKSGSTSKVQNIDGSWMVLVGEDPLGSTEGKVPSLIDLLLGDGGLNDNLKSMITIDDGESWSYLRVIDDDNCKLESQCSLHILSQMERDGAGKFVTGPTPGLMFAVGNTGKHIEKEVSKMHTYYSKDGGISWKFALDEPCLFSFGDLGNVVIAVPYYEPNYGSTNHFFYSVDHGATWIKVALETSIYPLTLTTTIDSTSTRFLLTGLVDKDPSVESNSRYSEIIYSLDFSKAFDGKKCGKDDYDEIYARVKDSEDPTCVYGSKEKYLRRKQDSKCFVSKVYEDLKFEKEPCKCTAKDFECSKFHTYSSEEGICKLDTKKITRQCYSEKKGTKLELTNTIRGSNNICKLEGQSEKDFMQKETINCDDYTKDNKGGEGGKTSNEIVTQVNVFEGDISRYNYFEKGENFNGENLVVKLSDNLVFASNNGGVDFVQVKIDEDVIGYWTGYVAGQIVLLTNTKKIYISLDGINFIRKFEAPTLPNDIGITPISFHKTDVNRFIWYSSENCVSKYSKDCTPVAYHTTDGGYTFTVLKEGVTKCDYIYPHLVNPVNLNNNTIFCQTDGFESGKIKLISSDDYFKTEKVHFENIVGSAFTGNFFVVATVKEENQSLRAKVTVDGLNFADADFPSNINVNANQAYTILDAMTESVFMHVTTNNVEGHEFGAILKSNSNGTSYVLSLDHVNRDRKGYVDYDRIDGLEGTIIANTVENANEVRTKKESKKLKTQISHNDGAEWSYLTPPTVDSKGKKYSCIGSSIAKCSLNLHGYTERADYRDTFSSASATGLIIGVGNVGEFLESYSSAATFISKDGGITWKEISSGVHMWEYGDRGTILVLIKSKEPTQNILYSLDEGDTWIDYKFYEEPINVLDLATVPSDTSRKFLVFAHDKSEGRNTLSISFDFSNVHKRQCQLDLDNPDNDDFEYWTPKHPKLPDNCLFGHESYYLRRAVGHNDCFIGSAPLKEGFKTIRNCSCTRRDFECDYNFYGDTDGTCKLVPGLSASDRQSESCKKEGAFEYFEPTGYRKIPLSTCVGGKAYDSWNAHACPGKEKEFNKHYGKEISGSKVLILVFVPLFVFLFSVWFVYDRGIRRNGGFKRLGQIRLDLDDDQGGFQPIEENTVDMVVNRIVSGGIFVVAGAIAVFKTARKFDRYIFDKLTSSIFRRSRSRSSNYVQVPTDLEAEEELFRDDYEDELNEDGINVNANPFYDEDNGELADDDIANFHDEEERDPRDVDSRLFNIDDHSDDDLSTSR